MFGVIFLLENNPHEELREAGAGVFRPTLHFNPPSALVSLHHVRANPATTTEGHGYMGERVAENRSKQAGGAAGGSRNRLAAPVPSLGKI